MLEVVFDDSAAGSLRQAFVGEPREIEQGIPLFHVEELSPEEHARLWEENLRWQQEQEARQRRGWAEGLPIAGSIGDIMSLPLYLSVGEIAEKGIGPQRQAALEGLMGTYPSIAREVAEELLQRGRASLAAILARAGGGEGVRVWTSDTPDEACGLAWLVHQLAALDLEKVPVTRVKLPDFYERSDGTVVRWRRWGEMDPWMWGRMVGLGQRLPVSLLRGLDAQWRALQRENAPLRAVLNGKLVSVPETWYDPGKGDCRRGRGIHGRPGDWQGTGKVPAGHRGQGTGPTDAGHDPGRQVPAGDLSRPGGPPLSLPPAQDPRRVEQIRFY